MSVSSWSLNIFKTASYFEPRGYPKGSSVIALVCVCVRSLVFKYLGDRSLVFSNFGPWVYPRRSLVIALVRSSGGPSVFEDLRDFSLVIYDFCMKLGHHKGTKVSKPAFWKKLLGVTNGVKSSFLGHFWCFLSISLHPVIKSFWNFTYITSSTLSNS